MRLKNLGLSLFLIILVLMASILAVEAEQRINIRLSDQEIRAAIANAKPIFSEGTENQTKVFILVLPVYIRQNATKAVDAPLPAENKTEKPGVILYDSVIGDVTINNNNVTNITTTVLPNGSSPAPIGPVPQTFIGQQPLALSEYWGKIVRPPWGNVAVIESRDPRPMYN